MASLTIAGRVQYMPGPWGLNKALAGAQVELFDIDLGGGDDRIWHGSTDAVGRFSGNSDEWQDKKSLRVFDPRQGRWVETQVPDPSDVLLLKLRVTAQGHQHEVTPYLHNPPVQVPVIVPWGCEVRKEQRALVVRSQRALVVVNNTVAGGAADLRDLYRFIEAAGDAVAVALCGPHYAQRRSLNGSDATLAALLSNLRTLAARPEIDAIDLILNMHGSPGKMYFHGAPGVHVDQVRQQMQAVPGLARKLRLLYNTSCYGATHANAMRQAGFDTCIGANHVVANSATEYPAFLAAWVAGSAVAPAIAVADAAPLREPMDRYASEQLHFPDVDSRKDVIGNGLLTIGSVPA